MGQRGENRVQPKLHVHNIFDAFNPHGTGVTGHLKLRSLQLQNRVVSLARPGDIVAISADCSPAFVQYLLRITRASNILTVRYQVSPDLREHIDAHSVFRSLIEDSQWEMVRQRCPLLDPYMKSATIYQAARASGVSVSQSEWQAATRAGLVEKMNDKAVFYQECRKAGIPVPRYWVARSTALSDCVIDLLKEGHGPLYIRQTRSGGTNGNISVERTGPGYLIPELTSHPLTASEFAHVLKGLIRTSFGNEFVIAELLDLYASPGTMFYADDVGVSVVCHTGQILDRNRMFLGFSYPIRDTSVSEHFPSIEHWVRLLIEPWRLLGYRGYGNIDWMITKDGKAYLAERNPRQTSVVPPLYVANACAGSTAPTSSIIAPTLSIYTRDIMELDRSITFEEAHAELSKKKLLWQQSKQGQGVVVTIPPSPQLGINSLGIMVLGPSLARAYEIYGQALQALGAKEERLLFQPKI